MQKTFYLKKNCFLCNKITLCSLESKVIKSQIKCNVYKCQNCSLVFLDKKFVNRKLKKNYYENTYIHKYDENFKKNSNNIYKKIYDAIKTFTKKREVLEIGPGGGYLYSYLKNNVKEYHALEVSAKMREELKKKFNIQTYKSFAKINKKFDVVIIVSVLEHVKNPASFLKKISSYLKRDGKIIIQVPNVNDPLVSLYDLKYYKENYFRKVHLNYFNQYTLAKLIKKLNFKILFKKSILTYSLTNHLNWLYKKKGNKNSYEATNIFFGNSIGKDSRLLDIFSTLDRVYKKELEYKKLGDIEICVCKK